MTNYKDSTEYESHPLDTEVEVRGIRACDIGLGAENPWMGSCSFSRLLMGRKQLPQALVPINPDPEILQSGLEKDLHHHTHKIDIPADCVVRSIIPLGENPWRKTIIYREIETGIIGHVELKGAWVGDGKFGFLYKPTAFLNDVHVDAVLDKGTPLMEPLSSINDQEHNTGIEADTAIISLPETAEDGILLSDEFTRNARFSKVDDIHFTVGLDKILINAHEGNQLPMPGTTLDENNIIAVVRSIANGLEHIQLNNKQLSEIDHIADTVYQLQDGGTATVIDLDVIPGNTHKYRQEDSQIEQLGVICQNYKKEICSEYKRIAREDKQNGVYGGVQDATSAMITNYEMLTDHGRRSTNAIVLDISKSRLNPYTIKITLARTMTLDAAGKLSDRFSSKGVRVAVWPKADMPGGADVAMSAESAMNRNIAGRSHVHYIKDCIAKSTVVVRSMMGTDRPVSLSKGRSIAKKVIANPTLFKEVITYIGGLYDLINKYQGKKLREYQNDKEEMVILLSDILSRGIIVGQPLDVVSTGNQGPKGHGKAIGGKAILKALKGSIYNFEPECVTYRAPNGERVTTHNPIRIAPIYYFILDKLGKEYSATYSVKKQVRGLTDVASTDGKNTETVTASNSTLLGVDESSIAASVLGPAATALYIRSLQDHRYNAAYTKAALKDGKLRPKVSVKDIDLNGSRGLRMVNHVFNALGIESEYRPDSKN